jgi:hypothetical protein
MSPNRLLLVGFVLLLAGAVLPFLMVVRALEPSLFLSFASYASTVAGLILGLYGAAMIEYERRRRERTFPTGE